MAPWLLRHDDLEVELVVSGIGSTAFLLRLEALGITNDWRLQARSVAKYVQGSIHDVILTQEGVAAKVEQGATVAAEAKPAPADILFGPRIVEVNQTRGLSATASPAPVVIHFGPRIIEVDDVASAAVASADTAIDFVATARSTDVGALTEAAAEMEAEDTVISSLVSPLLSPRLSPVPTREVGSSTEPEASADSDAANIGQFRHTTKDKQTETWLVWDAEKFTCKRCAKPPTPNLPRPPSAAGARSSGGSSNGGDRGGRRTGSRRGRNPSRGTPNGDSANSSQASSHGSAGSSGRAGSNATTEDSGGDASALLATAQAEPALVSEFLPTSVASAATSLLLTMKHWNPPRSQRGCCPFHTSVLMAKGLIRRLLRDPCNPLWSPFKGWQCRACTCMNHELVPHCEMCGGLRTLPGEDEDSEQATTCTATPCQYSEDGDSLVEEHSLGQGVLTGLQFAAAEDGRAPSGRRPIGKFIVSL